MARNTLVWTIAALLTACAANPPPLVDAGADAPSARDGMLTDRVPQDGSVADLMESWGAEDVPAPPDDLVSDLHDTADTPTPDLAEDVPVMPVFNGPCDFAPLEDWPTESAQPGAFQVGQFDVTLGAVSSLSATTGEAGTTVFATGQVVDYLAALQADVLVTEEQGSFAVDAAPTLTCTKPVIKSVVHLADRVAFNGEFKSPDVCVGRHFQIRFCQPTPGHLAFEVDVPADFQLVRLAVDGSTDERIVGLGEQFPHDELDLKGRSIPVIAQEGGIGRGHPVISPAVNLVSDGSSGTESSSYFPAPFYFTSRGRSVMLENTEYARFDFTSALQNRITVLSSRLRGRAFADTEPLNILTRYTEYAGRMPGLPAWVHEGAIVALARPLDEGLAIVQQLVDRGTRIAAVWNQTWSGVSETYIGEQVLWNWVLNTNHHPDWDNFVDALAQDGIRTLCYVNPMFRDLPDDAGPGLRNLFQEGLDNDYFVKADNGEPLLQEVTAFDVALLDFTNEAARAWMKDVLLSEMVEHAGCSGWMADFAEALPFDALLHDGTTGADYHNLYPVAWARLNREALEEAGLLEDVLFFSRSGHTTSLQHAMLFWEGDQLTTWDKYDGLISALHGLLNGGLSGITFNHSDTGGYTSLSMYGLGYSRESLLLKRWTEMNAFTAVLRTHEGNQPGQNAQVYSDDEAMDHFARFSKVYAALAFYRKQLEQEATDKGWPLVRHLLLHYPDAPQAWTVDDQILLGTDILVAPTLDKCPGWPFCNDERSVVLPPGPWVHLWSGAAYGSADAWQTITVDAPVGKPAVFYRAGSETGATFVANLTAMGVL